jgi:hypothetical protein
MCLPVRLLCLLSHARANTFLICVASALAKQAPNPPSSIWGKDTCQAGINYSDTNFHVYFLLSLCSFSQPQYPLLTSHPFVTMRMPSETAQAIKHHTLLIGRGFETLSCTLQPETVTTIFFCSPVCGGHLQTGRLLQCPQWHANL